MSMFDSLSSLVPAPAAPTGIPAVPDLLRIVALPKRLPLDCQRDIRTRRYPAKTQALIEVVTARYSRGTRLSCACRPRRVLRNSDSTLTITRVLPEGVKPEAPMIVELEAFVADNRSNTTETQTAQTVTALRPGDEVTLPAADGESGHPCITVLNPVQAWTLNEASEVGGIVGFLGVGSGKSIAGLLAPLAFPDCKLAALVIEPKQRQHYRSHYLRLREHFRVSSIIFDDGAGYTVPGTPPLHLISYSILSRMESSDMLDRLAPDTLILDESHRVTGNSAINRRCKRYLADRILKREQAIAAGQPVRARAVNLIGWSGTLESKSVKDTQMLCAYSLGTGSPLPLDPNEAEAWSQVIDTNYKPDRTSRTAKALQRAFGKGEVDNMSLTDLLMEAPEEAIRKGFQQRRLHTRGVVSASASSINAAIYFSERIPPKMPEVVKTALMQVRIDWLRPDGEELVEKIEQISTAKNVACGFYSYWAFPKHPCKCAPTRTVNDPQCDQCQLITDWYAQRKAYNKALRTKLQSGEVHLDSPKLCADAAVRYWQSPRYTGVLPQWECAQWPAWSAIEKRVEYDERVKWLDDWLARDAAEWATKNKGVVWFTSTAFGRRIAELAELPYFNGGPGGEERLRAEKGNRSIICSIPAHGAGTDGLQYLFSKQLITEMPASNASTRGLEQLLGRLHREGQKEDVVETFAYLHTTEFKDALRKAIEQAEFNFAMTGNLPKLLFADLSVDV